MIAALALAAAVARAAEPVKNPDTFTLAEIQDVSSLDPAFPYEGSSQSIIQNVYETLIGFKGSSVSEFEPRIAERVPSLKNGLISRDGRRYAFPIRKGVKFQDGTEVTPEDVRYSLLRFMIEDPAGGPSALLLEPIAGTASTRDDAGRITLDYAALEKRVRVEGRDVVIELPRPFGPFLAVMARWSYVVPKAWCAAHGEWDGTAATWRSFNDAPKEKSYLFEHMNGAGPFKLARWDRTARYTLLERHDGYWRGPAKLRRVLIKTVPELNTRKLMLEAGDADLIETPRPYVSQLAGLPGVRIADKLPRLQTDPALFFTFKINPVANPDIGSGRLDGDGIPPDFFADTDVRKGFAYAFDYQGFINDVWRGKGTQAHGAIPKSLPGYNPRQQTYRYDPKKAEEHFRKAMGGKLWDTGFHFTIAFNSGNLPRQTVCQIIKRNVEALNPKFKIDVRSIEWPTFLDAQNASKLPLFVLGWNADYPDPHNFAFPILDSKGNYPQIQKYENPEMDRLVDEGERETSSVKRKQIYARLQALEFEEVPHLVIVDTVLYRTQRSWVKGWYNNPIFPDAPYGSYFYPLYKE